MKKLLLTLTITILLLSSSFVHAGSKVGFNGHTWQNFNKEENSTTIKIAFVRGIYEGAFFLTEDADTFHNQLPQNITYRELAELLDEFYSTEVHRDIEVVAALGFLKSEGVGK